MPANLPYSCVLFFFRGRRKFSPSASVRFSDRIKQVCTVYGGIKTGCTDSSDGFLSFFYFYFFASLFAKLVGRIFFLRLAFPDTLSLRFENMYKYREPEPRVQTYRGVETGSVYLSSPSSLSSHVPWYLIKAFYWFHWIQLFVWGNVWP